MRFQFFAKAAAVRAVFSILLEKKLSAFSDQRSATIKITSRQQKTRKHKANHESTKEEGGDQDTRKSSKIKRLISFGFLWKPSIDIFSMEKPDECNRVLLYSDTQSVISNLDTKIGLIALDFSHAL